MTLTGNYGLVLPKNYVSIEKDEMEYIDGGGWVFDDIYRGTDAYYQIAEFGGVTIGAVFGMIKFAAAALATSATIVGAIVCCIGFLGSLISAT